MIYLLNHKNGQSFKNIMETKSNRLTELIIKDRNSYRVGGQVTPHNFKDEFEAQKQAVTIVYTLVQLNNQWLPTQVMIVNALKTIWANDLHKSNDLNIVCNFWHQVARILLHYFEHDPSDIHLLFQLVKVFNMRFVPDFQVSNFSFYEHFFFIRSVKHTE
jgi:transformation/transcription domain-associated protein